jgi:hypothetical protein
MDFKTKRLSSANSNYKRPEITYTDTLQTKELIKEKLKGYVKVDNIDDVSPKTHVRYIIFDRNSNSWKFRTGGVIAKTHKKYIVLANGNNQSWSVQREVEVDDGDNIYETQFYKVLSIEQRNEMKLREQLEEIRKLKDENRQLKKNINS